jgi:hypothetical protein
MPTLRSMDTDVLTQDSKFLARIILVLTNVGAKKRLAGHQRPDSGPTCLQRLESVTP